MYRAEGQIVFPGKTDVFVNENEMVMMINNVINSSHYDGMCVLKTHEPYESFQKARFIHVNRDLRDILVSTMRFMNFDFDTALNFVAGNARIAEHYRKFPSDVLINIDYADIIANPVHVAESLCDFLKLRLTSAHVREIVSDFAKEKVAAITKDLGKPLADAPSSDRPRVKIRQEDGHERRLDLLTGFQEGHVSDYQCGDWRTLMSPEQQEAMTRVFGEP